MSSQFEVIIQLGTLFTLLAGVIFGILELRRANKVRAEKAAIDVFNVILQEAFNDAHILILNLPQDVTPDQIRNSFELRRAAELLMSLYEYWGIMVFNRIIPLQTLDLLVGGTVRGSWKRLYKYIESERNNLEIPAFGEWYQWLAERLEQHPQLEKQVGAHIAFSTWKP